MNPRTYLRHLIKRIEPQIKDIRPTADGEIELARARAGKHFLTMALSDARKALASNDDDGELWEAYGICASLALNAYELAYRNHALDLRRAGGKRRGEQQTSIAAAVWASWKRKNEELLAQGVSSPDAFRVVKAEMTRHEFVLPTTGEFPSDAAIRKWLK
jgi:hypothetical protein